MQRLNQDQKLFTIIGGGILLILIIVGVVLVPTVRSIQQANKEVYDLRLYLEQKHSRSVSARSAIKQIDAIQNSMVGLEKYVYRSGDELRLITLLEDISNRHTVTQQIKASNLDAISNQRVTMSLNLTGTWRAILEYLQDLEQADYFISLNRLVMGTFTDRNRPITGDQVNLDLEITLYVAQ